MAAEEGIAQILPFDTFKDLMLQKFGLSITPVMSNSLQMLTSDQGIFSFKSHSTNPEKYSIIPNACIIQLSDIFKILIDQESQVLKQTIETVNRQYWSGKKICFKLCLWTLNKPDSAKRY